MEATAASAMTSSFGVEKMANLVAEWIARIRLRQSGRTNPIGDVPAQAQRAPQPPRPALHAKRHAVGTREDQFGIDYFAAGAAGGGGSVVGCGIYAFQSEVSAGGFVVGVEDVAHEAVRGCGGDCDEEEGHSI